MRGGYPEAGMDLTGRGFGPADDEAGVVDGGGAGLSAAEGRERDELAGRCELGGEWSGKEGDG